MRTIYIAISVIAEVITECGYELLKIGRSIIYSYALRTRTSTKKKNEIATKRLTHYSKWPNLQK